MPASTHATALIYAKDLQRMSTFYRRLLDMRLVHADPDHHVTESGQLQLIVHAIPAHIAATSDIASPPELREEQAIKLLFTIASLAAAEAVAPALGGALIGKTCSVSGFNVRDGHDPEGNIFELRAHAH
jgi:predicted enzyme related to lactoylglutathione lyase